MKTQLLRVYLLGAFSMSNVCCMEGEHTPFFSGASAAMVEGNGLAGIQAQKLAEQKTVAGKNQLFFLATQPNLGSTHNTTDRNAGEFPRRLSIQGEGFFIVGLPGEGIGYSRGGELVLRCDGTLMISGVSGCYPLYSQGGDFITVPENALYCCISSEGIVHMERDGCPPEWVNRIGLVSFLAAVGSLVAKGDGLFLRPDDVGEPIIVNPGENGAGILQCEYDDKNDMPVVIQGIVLE